MAQSFPRPWYCTRSVHGVVGHQTNIDGVALLRSQETPCDCVPPFVPTKPKKAPIRVTAVRRQRDPWRLSRRDRAVLARLQDPTSRNGGYNEMIDRRQCSPLPPYPDDMPSTMVVPPCERQVADASAPPGINVVRPLTDYLNFYQPEPKRNDFLEPSDLPLSQRALYNLYNPEFGYGGYGPPPAHPETAPTFSMPFAGEMGPPYSSAAPPPLPDAPPLPLPTTTTTTATSLCPCGDRHAAFVPYGICFCPVCGECLLPAGQAPTQTPATCPSTHQRRDRHHAEEWKVPSAVPLQEANYCLLCGCLLVQTPTASAAAAPTDVNLISPPVSTAIDAAVTNDLLPPLPPPPPPPYQSEMPLPIPVPDAASPIAVPTPAIPPPLTDVSLPLPSPPPQNTTPPSPLAAAAATTVTATTPAVNGSHTIGGGPTYAEINQEDRNMVDLVLNKLVYNVAGQRNTHTNCGLHDCLICHGGGTAMATAATAPATVLGGPGTAVCITHNYFYK